MKRQIIAMAMLALLICGASPTLAAETPKSFRADIARIYNFPVGKLSDEQRVAKAAEMDVFWKKVEKDKASLLPVLRQEIGNPANPAFFAFDGAALLRSLSDDKADGQLALDAITRIDPKLVSGEGYVSTIHRFAVEGYDVVPAALKIADQPDFNIYYGFHVMPMNQFNALVYMLFPLEEQRFVGALVNRLMIEKNEKTQKSLIITLSFAVTPEAQAGLRVFLMRKDIGGEVRKEAKKRVDYKGHTHDASESANAIRKRRRAITTRSIGHSFWNDFHEASEALMHKVQLP